MLMYNKKFVINNTQLIEDSLNPLVNYMENPKKIEFDEDIITIIYLIINHNKKVTPLSLSLTKNLYKYCDKSGGILLDLYMLVNAYLAYGTEAILSNEEYLLGIINLFNSGIKAIKFRNSPFYSCILIQSWIANCINLPKDIINELFNNIIKHIISIFENYYHTKSIGDDAYNYLGYVTSILCGLINYSPIIISLLQKTKSENCLKDWLELIVKENKPGFEYEIKIIIYSISLVIQKGILMEI